MALQAPSHSYHTIANILKNGLDKTKDKQSEQMEIPFHNNIRGSKNYN